MASDGCQPLPRAQYPVYGVKQYYDAPHTLSHSAPHQQDSNTRGNTGTWCARRCSISVIHVAAFAAAHAVRGSRDADGRPPRRDETASGVGPLAGTAPRRVATGG
jgi:hypothetical protein